MNGHEFNFQYGDILTKMGASWFVSRAYYEYVDGIHSNWDNVKTYPYRIRIFNNNKIIHKYFLEQIEMMEINNLNRNTIGINGSRIKEMALEILNSQHFLS